MELKDSLNRRKMKSRRWRIRQMDERNASQNVEWEEVFWTINSPLRYIWKDIIICNMKIKQGLVNRFHKDVKWWTIYTEEH